jgi:hypothetical protein
MGRMARIRTISAVLSLRNEAEGAQATAAMKAALLRDVGIPSRGEIEKF